MSETKELDYFVEEKNFHKGISWYESQFDEHYPWRGESSQNYSKRHHFKPVVADRIGEVLPDARLVYIVRDPIARIVSHYHEAVEGGYHPKEGMNAFLSKHPANNHYVLTSSYYYQLQAYLPHYSLERIHCLSLEDLKRDPLSEMNRIFRFLGVSELNNDEPFRERKNTRADKRAQTALCRFVKSPASGWLRGMMTRRLKDTVKSGPVSSLLSKPMQNESLDTILADTLRETLADDIDKFRALTGKRFSEWSV